MTNVVVTKKPGFFNIEVSGHADFAPDGEPDILCAIISGITQSPVAALIQLAEQYPENVRVEVNDYIERDRTITGGSRKDSGREGTATGTET